MTLLFPRNMAIVMPAILSDGWLSMNLVAIVLCYNGRRYDFLKLFSCYRYHAGSNLIMMPAFVVVDGGRDPAGM